MIFFIIAFYFLKFTLHIFSVGHLKQSFLDVIKSNKESHFFLDEVPAGVKNGYQKKDFMEFSEKIPKENFFWLACQSLKPPKSKQLEGMSLKPKMSQLKLVV